MSYKGAVQKLKNVPNIQKKFNIFCHINERAIDSLENGSSKKSLSNLLVGIKDNIVTSDMPTTCASKILLNYHSPFDATVVKQILNEGVAIVGKTNMDEFGMGSGGVHSHFGPTHNPLFKNIPSIAGGSSSGSAAAVAADVVDFALGTDTGGSIRLPAAYTSTLGFKPSYGRISRYGVIAYAQSFDTVGIIAKEMPVLRKVFLTLDKYDTKDPTSLKNDLRSELEKLYVSKKSYKIGIPQEFVQDSLPNDIRQHFYKFVKRLMDQGHEIVPVSIPSVKYALPIYYTLTPSEAVSNMSRYDGIRYGTRDKEKDIEEDTLYAPTRSNFGSAVKERIILGNFNLCSRSFKNNYVRAQKLRVQLINEFDSVFKFPNVLSNSEGNPSGIDIILSLTAMNEPQSISDFISKSDTSSPTIEYINDVFTMPMSLAGLPTISIPIERGQPIGVQLAGQFGDDSSVLDLADSLV